MLPFFTQKRFRVTTKSSRSNKYPKTEISCSKAIQVALSLSKAGYGTPEQIMEMNAEIVMSALDYENFKNEYEQEYMQLNRE